MSLVKYQSNSWFISRKYVIISLIIDISLIFLFFLNQFDLNGSKKYLFSFISLTLIWILISYIIGRYTPSGLNFKGTLIKHLNISCKNIFIFSIFIFFLSLFKFIDNSSVFTNFKFQIYWNLLTGVFHFFHEILLKTNKKKIWILFGNKFDLLFINKYLKANHENEKVILKDITKLQNFDDLPKNDGLIFSNNISKEKIKSIRKYNDRSGSKLKVFHLLDWCKIYLNMIPSELISENIQFKSSFIHNSSSFKMKVKRFFDIFLSIIILLFCSPIILISMVIIFAQDRGQVFYSQPRSGLNGKIIAIKKLRTMHLNAEEKGAQWSTNNDERITKFGRFLRNTRIDEIPQLIAVIKGDMSLIGPRPERPEIEESKLSGLKNYDLKFLVKPGLSGWSQVNYPYGASVEDSEIKLSFDLFYIVNYSLLLDIVVFFKTLKLVLNAKGANPKN